MWKRLQSQEKVLEKKALTLLHLCPKILAYRKDKIGETVTTQIVNNYNALEQSYQAWEKDKSHTRELELRIEALHNQLKTHGNGLYPLNFWNENAKKNPMFLKKKLKILWRGNRSLTHYLTPKIHRSTLLASRGKIYTFPNTCI